MKTNRMTVAAVLAIVVLGAASAAQAGFISGVTVDSVSSENATRLGSYTIDADASFDPVAGTLKEGSRGWMTLGSNALDYSPTIVYNLGGVYDLASIRIWNWNQTGGSDPGYAGQGFKDVNISVAGADKAFSPLKTVALDIAPGADGYTGQKITAGVSGVQYVQITGIDSWFATEGFDPAYTWENEAGLGKVMFTAVPEPSTCVLLGAAAAGLLAYAWRKRQSA